MKASRGIDFLVLTIALASLMNIMPAVAWDNLLQNTSFEEGVTGWLAYGGNFIQVSSPVHGGDFAASFTSNSIETKWIYQVVRIVPGESYTFSGWVIRDAPDEYTAVYLRISWYESEDGFGSEISHKDSLTVLTDDQPEYSLLTTGNVIAPADTRSARVKAILTPHSEAPVTACFDNFSFTGPAPTPTPTPTATPAATPAATPTPTPTPTSTPTPTPTPILPPTPTITPAPMSTYTPMPTPMVMLTPTPTPTPAPSSANEGDIVISEIQYDPLLKGVDTAFEWLEIFNRTGRMVDLTGWRIADNQESDQIPSLNMLPGGFTVIAAGVDFYTSFPNFTGTIVFIPDGSIGNGLSNTGDCLIIMDPMGNVIDALSYGDDDGMMSPSCQDVAEGHSLERQPAGLDTNHASDFLDNAIPSPGYGLAFVTPTPTLISAPAPTLRATPSPTTAPTPTVAPLIATSTPTTTAGLPATPAPTVTLTPPLTQTPSSSAGQNRTWLHIGIPSLLSVIGLTSLAVVFWLKRKG